MPAITDVNGRDADARQREGGDDEPQRRSLGTAETVTGSAGNPATARRFSA
jgi:hypothetical protein